VVVSCGKGKRKGSSSSRVRLGNGHGLLGGAHPGHTCSPSRPAPGCVSAAPVAQSTPPPGGFGGAGGCRPFGTLLVPGASWLNGHGVDVISNGCTYSSYVYGTYGWEWQCVELFERLINQEGWYSGFVSTSPSGGAKDLYPNAPSSAFDKHPNGSGYIPVPGDAIVFYGYPDDPYGHVAIVRSVNATSVDVVEQNDMGSGTATLSLSGSTIGNEGALTVEGILHAKANTQNGGGSNGGPNGGGVPTTGTKFVMLSSGSGFGSPQDWSNTPFYGSRATLVCDVNGDGKADLVAVNDSATFVMLSSGSGFGSPQDWSNTPFYGSKATLCADVNGDGKADLIAVDDNATFVMLSNGSGFGSVQDWSAQPFYGSVATFAGDVNGDRKADLVAVDGNATFVMLSSGSGFGAVQGWSSTPFYGSRTTLACDVNGDGKADLVAVNDSATFVMPSSGSGFGSVQDWSNTPFYGSKATLCADVNGDGKADLIAVDDNATFVMLSTGSGFGSPQGWSGQPFYGSVGTFAGDVNGDRKADLIAVN